jgi:hypothetical protein
MDKYYKRSSIQQSSETCLYVFCSFVLVGVLTVAAGFTQEIVQGATILIDLFNGR